jgi:hypothetical protein
MLHFKIRPQSALGAFAGSFAAWLAADLLRRQTG